MRETLLGRSTPTVGLMIFAIQSARDVVARMDRPVEAAIAAAAIGLMANAWSSLAPRFPEIASPETHAWLSTLGAFGVDKAQTVDGLHAYKDAIATRAPYIDQAFCALALELAAQAMALAYTDGNAGEAGAWSLPCLKPIHAAALLGIKWRLSDHIAPRGPLPQDPGNYSLSRDGVALEVTFLPSLRLKLTTNFGQRVWVLGIQSLMRLCAFLLSDTPLQRCADGRVVLKLSMPDEAAMFMELDPGMARQVASALTTFLDDPLPRRWLERAALTTGWA